MGIGNEKSRGGEDGRFRNGAAPEEGQEEDLSTLDYKLGQAMSSNSFGFLMSTLSKATREHYLGDWIERNLYCKMRGLSPRICATETEWGNKITDYLIWLGEMFKCSAATVRREMAAIRRVHLAAGLADFPRTGIRCKMLTKAYSAKRPTNRKLPFNVDLMRRAYNQFEGQMHKTATKELWESLVISFSFACVPAKWET